MPRLELLGAEVAERGVDPHPVVEALDVVEYLQCRLIPRLERAGVHALRLDEPHERLHRRVVPRARDRAHRRPDAGLAHRLADQERDVLAPVVAMVDAASGRPAPHDRHPQRVVGELGRHAGRHRPADDLPGPDVHHDRQAGPPLVRAHVGDVGEPGPVRAVRAEVSPHEVGRRVGLRRCLPGLALGALGAAARRAGPAVLAHDVRRALARRALSAPAQLREDLRGAVDAAARLVDLGDLAGELGVAQVAPARPARAPRVVALPGDAERRAHLRHAPAPLAEQGESEPRLLRLGAYSCLPAKKALAFKSISFSLLSRSFSRLSRRRSSAIWKGLASASGAAAEALLTQSARLDGSTPISRATSA